MASLSTPTVRTRRSTWSLRLTARLRGPQTGTISFYGNAGGGKKLIDRVKVGARGKAVLEVKPSRHTTYTAEYPGTATFASAKSRERSVKVGAPPSARRAAL